MAGYHQSVPPDEWWDWLNGDPAQEDVDPWDERSTWLEEEFGWTGWSGEYLAALTGSEEEDEGEDEDERTTRVVWYEDDEGELKDTVTWGKRETRTSHKDKRWVYCCRKKSDLGG